MEDVLLKLPPLSLVEELRSEKESCVPWVCVWGGCHMTMWMTQDPHSRDYLGTVTVCLSLNQIGRLFTFESWGLITRWGDGGGETGRAKAFYYFLLRVSNTRDLALAQ